MVEYSHEERPSRQLSTAEERRETVLRTAIGAFAARGYRGTTTAEVAKAAGISQAYVYRLFPSKESLFTAVVEAPPPEPAAAAPPVPHRTAPGNVLMALLGSVWIALFFFLPLYQQQVLGSSPQVTGVGQLPLAFANMLGSTLAPRIPRRIGSTATVIGALLTESAGLLWLSRISPDGSYLADVLGPSILIGLGLSIAFVQLTTLSVEGVPQQDAGLAGGLVNTTRQVGGAIGLAVLATLAGTTTAHAAGHRPHLEALTAGYRTAFGASAAALAAAAALALLLTRRTAAPTRGTRRG
ncbi:MFS transporter [Streptomyces sp. NPDC047079]|uniref:MFS transporter n=1 Tax=Streptomyces sp. NPDC047079 TaxID=3154607 RepID=UPI0033E9EF9D